MGKLLTDVQEISSIITSLELDPEMVNWHSDINLRLQQHSMTDIPWMPDYLKAAGKTVVMNSPRIPTLAQQIGAVVASYTTTVTSTPDKRDDQAKADKAEKAYAIRREDLFTPQVSAITTWRQLVVGADIYKLRVRGVNNPNPWGVLQPDIQSCFFMMGEESKRTMRPSLMGRKYTNIISTAKNFYDAREGKMPVKKNGVWDFMYLNEDKYSQFDYSTIFTQVKDQFKPEMFYEYDDSEYSYIIALNDRDSSNPNGGQILWSGKNLTGGSSYVIVPGYMTGSTEMREKILPHLWGPMNVQYQIDVINTLRATRSMNIKPQVLMERSPQLLAAAQQLGIARAAPDGYESQGADTIIELDGKPHFWVLPEDKDLAALEESKQAELRDYISTELSLTNAETIKDAAVRNIQLALGIRSQQQGPMLTYKATGQREILKMWRSTICEEGGFGADDWGLTSMKPDPYGTNLVKPGEYVAVNKAMLEFGHSVEVNIASMSEQERQFMIQAAMERKVSRIGTWPEVIDAAGYQNRTEQMDNLVEEEAYEGASQYYGPYLQPTFRQRMAERIGILIPSPADMAQATDPGSQATPQMNANATQSFPVPQTKQVAGASDAGGPTA